MNRCSWKISSIKKVFLSSGSTPYGTIKVDSIVKGNSFKLHSILRVRSGFLHFPPIWVASERIHQSLLEDFLSYSTHWARVFRSKVHPTTRNNNPNCRSSSQDQGGGCSSSGRSNSPSGRTNNCPTREGQENSGGGAATKEEGWGCESPKVWTLSLTQQLLLGINELKKKGTYQPTILIISFNLIAQHSNISIHSYYRAWYSQFWQCPCNVTVGR